MWDTKDNFITWDTRQFLLPGENVFILIELRKKNFYYLGKDKKFLLSELRKIIFVVCVDKIKFVFSELRKEIFICR